MNWGLPQPRKLQQLRAAVGCHLLASKVTLYGSFRPLPSHRQSPWGWHMPLSWALPGQDFPQTVTLTLSHNPSPSTRPQPVHNRGCYLMHVRFASRAHRRRSGQRDPIGSHLCGIP